jgi:hypothetical protein
MSGAKRFAIASRLAERRDITVTEPEEFEEFDVQTRLAMLGEVALRQMPRLFCLYGARRKRLLRGDDRLFIGWGMEFSDLGKALWWQPGGATSHSDSAASLLDHRQMIGDAHLVWLDGDRD